MEKSIYVFRLKRFCNISYCYRYDPVPWTGRRRNGHSYRRMRTTQEIRMYYAHKDEVHIRGRRKPCNLPTWYDDILVSDLHKFGRASSWKRNKKKRQWM
jgi:hypothetical protein